MDPREEAGGSQRDAAADAGDPGVSPGRRRGLRWSEAAWLAILMAIGIVQIVRAQWFDAAVFLVVVLALGADAAGLMPHFRSRVRPGLRRLIAGAAVFGAAMCVAPRHGGWMAAVVIAAGVTALALAWPQPDGPPATPWSRGLQRLAIAWSVILVAGCLWELLQFILGRVEPRLQWFALSDLVDPLVSSIPGRVLFIAAWVAAGVFLVRRGRRP